MMSRLVRAVVLGLTLLLGAPCLAPAAQGGVATYANPLDVIVADPFVLRHGDTYYLYGTSARDGFHVWSSKNLVDWKDHGYCFQRSDNDYGRRKFWAPEVFEQDGKFYLHYSVVGRGSSHRIVLAVADSPLGPFREKKAPWFASDKAIIDSNVFKDDNGQLYLYYVLDCSENGDSEIYVRKISTDVTVIEKDDHFCAKPSQPWEGEQWNEAPFVFKRGKTYFLMYSANCYVDTNYNIGYATASSPLGPWTKSTANPLVCNNKDVSGPGHNSVIDSPDGKELFLVYHSHQQLTGGTQRHLGIDRMRVIEEPGKAPTLAFDQPTVTPQPLPSGAKPLPAGLSDEFSGDDDDKLGDQWRIFNADKTSWKLSGGWLSIRTQDGDVFRERDDLQNLFLQHAPAGDYSVTTRLDFDPTENYQNAQLCVWEDHNNYLKIAIVHDDGLHLEIARERHIDYKKRLFPAGDQRYLRITKIGDTYAFAASTDGKQWNTLDVTFEASFNEPKIGIGAASPGTDKRTEAKFDFVHIDPITARASR
jgi:beta-xylosidase